MRRFTVDASKKIDAAIMPYRPSTSDLVRGGHLDGRFSYDLDETFTINLEGTPITCLTVDSEVASMAELGFLIDDEVEDDSCVDFTVLIPIPEKYSGEIADPDFAYLVDRALGDYLENELMGSDYCSSSNVFTSDPADYQHFLSLAEQKLPNAESNAGYMLAEVIIMPICALW